MRDTVLCLCDLTGNFAAPWIENGYHAILVDPQHDDGVGIHIATTEARRQVNITKIGRVIDDQLTWELIQDNAHRIAFVAAFPPCTDLAVSGARWFTSKASADPAFQFKAMQVVWQCHVIAEMLGVPYFIENPVGQVSTFWRKPDYTSIRGSTPDGVRVTITPKRLAFGQAVDLSCQNIICCKARTIRTTGFISAHQVQIGQTSVALRRWDSQGRYSKLTRI